MKMKSKQKITTFQLFVLLVHAQIGVGIITMPHDLFMVAGKDSWMSILIAGFTIQVMIFIYGYIIRKYPTLNLYEILKRIFGQIFGKILIIIYLLYGFSLGGVFLAKFVIILKSWMMPMTPKSVLILMVIILAIYAVWQDLPMIANFFTLGMVVIFVYIGFSFYAFQDTHITNLLPLGEKGFTSVFLGARETLSAYYGFEYILLLFPFVKADPKKITRAAFYSNLFVTVFYLILTVAVMLFFGSNQIQLIPEPVLYLVKSFSFRMIERPDLIFTSIWIVLVVTTLIMLFYTLTLGVSSLFNRFFMKRAILFVAGLCFILAMSIHGEYQIRSFSEYLRPFILIFSFGLPLFIVLIIKIFHKKEGTNH